MPHRKTFIFYIYGTGLDNISFGLSLNWALPNFDLHLPFCFVRIGLTYSTPNDRQKATNERLKNDPVLGKSFGFTEDR